MTEGRPEAVAYHAGVTRARFVRCLAAAAVTALAVAGCGREQPPTAGTEVVAAADRGDPVTLAGPALADPGAAIDLADYRGRVVVLNAWATWCEPCRAEIPALVALDEATDDADVAVVGLNVSDDPAAASAFAEEFAVAYPSITDPEGVLLPQVPGVPPRALPSTVVLDREGRVAVRVVGEIDPATFPGLVDAVVTGG
jgi:thiol-disulfide isomerase/thioredoxin